MPECSQVGLLGEVCVEVGLEPLHGARLLHALLVDGQLRGVLRQGDVSLDRQINRQIDKYIDR